MDGLLGVPTETFFKVRDPQSGQFQLGGSWVHWSKRGKAWAAIGHVKSHLRLLGQVSPGWQIVEYHTVVDNITRVGDLAK